MHDTLAAYPGLIRSATQVALVYRGRMAVWLLTQFFPLLLMAVWLTVVAGSGPPAGWTGSDFVSYYAAATLMWNLSGQHVVWDWNNDLRSGDLSYRLLRPLHPFHQYAAADLGYRVVYLAVLVPLLTAATLWVPGIRYDANPLQLFVVVAAIAIAYVLGLLMALTFALIGFWSTQTTNLWMLWWGMGSFASGWIAPVDLMPHWLRTVALALPFRATMGFPIELLMGRLEGREAVNGFAVALLWIGLFAAAYLQLWRRGIRRHQAVAG